jgi:hypothetical protein
MIQIKKMMEKYNHQNNLILMIRIKDLLKKVNE